MNVIKIVPRGYCIGVIKAIQMAKTAIKKFNYENKDVYMIGNLVHNKYIVNAFKKLNVTIIEEFNKSRNEIVSMLPNNSVVIFSAHGTAPEVIKICENKNITVVNTVCEFVTITEKLILEKLNQNYEVIFIGVKNHPETIALTSLGCENINFKVSNQKQKIDSAFFNQLKRQVRAEMAKEKKPVHLIQNSYDIMNLKIDQTKKIFATNQTTLSILETKNLYKLLKLKFPNIEIKNDICDAAETRQQAILNLDSNKIDLMIVIGDSISNNTKKLKEISISKNIPTIRINDLYELNLSILENINNVAVTAGTSTPSQVQKQVIDFLEQYPNCQIPKKPEIIF
ncbi:4-hydroxy-3-methylbut-2-enyl diphosphate reductase [Spiroplasma endosymbiont of Labia minor]|uniref:4-hydroxy-3-methylbut-2-enyl diphosphate reductase n=1 Tax=Spiroplasma endosymbiont of Labia minor TaxID=3066305 RepID=UPI0030D205DB